MTTARTQRFNVSRSGVARPRAAEPKPDDFTAVSAETFVSVFAGDAEVVEAFDPSTFGYDPADHTVEEVKAYVTENPDAADAILELEANGKARSGLLSFLENFTESED